MKQSNLTIENSKIINSSNINKSKCGIVTFNQNTDLSITNSEFYNNRAKSNGGVM